MHSDNGTTRATTVAMVSCSLNDVYGDQTEEGLTDVDGVMFNK